MQIPLHVTVQCRDGQFGISDITIIDPRRQAVSHVVVRDTTQEHTAYLVPIAYVVDSSEEKLTLDLSIAELKKMEPFLKMHYVTEDIPEYTGVNYQVHPYVVHEHRVKEEEVELVPPREVTIRRGTKVRALDGKVGTVKELVIDDESGHVTHFTLFEDGWFTDREISIPLTAVDRFIENIVYLNIDKEAIKNLPVLKIRRFWESK